MAIQGSIGEDGGINLYGYVGNDPIFWKDPLGLDPGILDYATGTVEAGLLTLGWASGMHPDEPINFGPDDPMTKLMEGDPGVKKAIAAYTSKNSKCPSGNSNFAPLTQYGIHF